MTDKTQQTPQDRPSTRQIVAANLVACLPALRFDDPACGEDDAPVVGRIEPRAGSFLLTLTGEGAGACADALQASGNLSIDLGIDGDTVDGVLVAMETTLHLTVSAIATLPDQVQVNLMTCYQSRGVDPATLPGVVAA